MEPISSLVTDMDMDLKSKIKKILYKHSLLALLIFVWLLVLAFVLWQYQREKEYKNSLLNSSLQQVNISVVNWKMMGYENEQLYSKARRHFPSIRLTLIDLWGNVLYDSSIGDISKLQNHNSRPEVKEALEKGQGFTISRLSESDNQYYFYSALRSDSLIVRTSLPYTTNLNHTLKASDNFIWFIVLITFIVSITAYVMKRRMNKTEQALKLEQEKSYREEQQKIRIKKQLTSSINHEIKTPVSAISGVLETLLDNPDLDRETTFDFIKQCYHQTQRLDKLLRDISIINKIDEGKHIIQKEQLSLKELIYNVVNEIKEDIPDLGIKINLMNMDHNPLHMVGNIALLRSVFRNLIDNAIAYSNGKNINLTYLGNNTTIDEIYYNFSFYDDGIGVSEEHLPYLFERFYRVDKGRSRKLGGTGLGLSIVKNAIILHGGNIEVKNRDTGGLEFHFNLKATNN